MDEEQETQVGDTGQGEIEPASHRVAEPVIDDSNGYHRDGKGG
jgi:hypothetical protein